MDNLCHTLVGLALAQAGLKRKTPLASAALVVGANLPDVDVLAYAAGPVAALGFRRGWTHGVLALAVWPFVLTGVMLAWDRFVRRRRDGGQRPAAGGRLLLVSTIAILTHPFLDWLNVYGLRWLMPFSGRWFYGDTLFIVEPLAWAALAVGVVWSAWRERRSRREGVEAWRREGRPARLALALVAAYIAVMAGISAAVRRAVTRDVRARGLEPGRVMVAPMPLYPLRREVVYTLPGVYQTGHTALFGRPAWDADAISDFTDLAASHAAAATATGRTYLSWARFPVYAPGPYDGCPAAHVCLRDVRFWRQAWAEVAIPVGAPVSLAPSSPNREQP